jgi:molecular chaperone DnaK (HSP70)
MDQKTKKMMWWIKAWSFIKRYWQAIAGFLVALITVFAFRKKPDADEILENEKLSNQKELEAIAKSEEILKNKSDKAEYLYKKALKEIEDRSKEQQKELSDNMKKEVERIIKEHQEDPSELTERISQLTGFVVHVEED